MIVSALYSQLRDTLLCLSPFLFRKAFKHFLNHILKYSLERECLPVVEYVCVHLPVGLAEFSQPGAHRTHCKTKRRIHWWQVTLLIALKPQSGFVSVPSQLLGFLRQRFETHRGKGKLQSNRNKLDCSG